MLDKSIVRTLLCLLVRTLLLIYVPRTFEKLNRSLTPIFQTKRTETINFTNMTLMVYLWKVGNEINCRQRQGAIMSRHQ